MIFILALLQKLIFDEGLWVLAGQAMAGTIFITVKNLTYGLYFTPLLITAHDIHTHLFELGVPALVELQPMAEGGISDLDSSIHRWLNPVAEVMIEVRPRHRDN